MLMLLLMLMRTLMLMLILMLMPPCRHSGARHAHSTFPAVCANLTGMPSRAPGGTLLPGQYMSGPPPSGRTNMAAGRQPAIIAGPATAPSTLAITPFSDDTSIAIEGGDNDGDVVLQILQF